MIDVPPAVRRGAGHHGVAHRRPRSRGARARRRSPFQRRARGVRRHREDARPGRSLRESAARGRRSARHSGDHVHAQGCRRDARADHHDAAPGRRTGGVFRRALARAARQDWAMSRSARSTRSACRCSASSRSRPTWTRVSRWPTKPRCRGSSDESLDRALRTCRSVARQDEHVALVFAQLGDRRAREGLAALLNRRIVAPSILGRYLSSGPRDLDGRRSRAPRRQRASRGVRVDARRARSISRDRSAASVVPSAPATTARPRAPSTDESAIDPTARPGILSPRPRDTS